ncbi:MAG: mevalonate kinase [Candidatus Altiarchaeia archaeon]
MPTKASAPGKVILLGEHAAVYGNPVLVASVDLRTYAKVSARKDEQFVLSNRSTGVDNLKFSFPDFPRLKKEWSTMLTIDCLERAAKKAGEKTGFDIEIWSEAPVSSGLGSSASAAAALTMALFKEMSQPLKQKEIADMAWKAEDLVHGKSSGVDPYAVTFGGVLRYTNGEYTRINARKCPGITIGNTGVKVDTKEPVTDVMKLKEKYPKFFEDYLSAMVHIVDYGQKYLQEGDVQKLGEIMNINHGLLSSIGVSSPELERLVWAARKVSPGAKLCGKGRGGIMIALGDAEKEIRETGGTVIKTKICNEGVRVED